MTEKDNVLTCDTFIHKPVTKPNETNKEESSVRAKTLMDRLKKEGIAPLESH